MRAAVDSVFVASDKRRSEMLSRCWNLARTRACGIDPPRRPASASVATASATQMMERILQHQHLSRTAVTSGGRLYSYEHVCSSSDRISHAISTIVGTASKQAAPPRIGLYAVRHSLHWGSWDHSSCGHACGTLPWNRLLVPNTWRARWRYGELVASSSPWLLPIPHGS